MDKLKNIAGKPFHYDDALNSRLEALDKDIKSSWDDGQLSEEAQRQVYEQSKIEAVYHSNRLEGNRLTIGETQQVIKENAVIPGKPYRDQRETTNLVTAINFAWETAFDHTKVITQNFVRQFHDILLDGIQDDAGRYRVTPNKIWGSAHETPEAFLVPQLMANLSDYLKQATSQFAEDTYSPVCSAAAAHALFGQIHPFTDGNGRTARHAIVDTILIRHGYPPCIIAEDDRPIYIDALEKSWGNTEENGDLTALMELMHDNIREQMQFPDWLSSLRAAFEAADTNAIQPEYRFFVQKMEFLRVQFEYYVDMFNAVNLPLRGKVITFPAPSIEKYSLIQNGIRVRQRRHFVLEFRGMGKMSRYLFFFNTPECAIGDRTSMALAAYKSTDAGHIPLSELNARGIVTPDTFEIGYDIRANCFVANGVTGVRKRNPQKLAQSFLKQVIERDFAT